jgi:hypothetical protein
MPCIWTRPIPHWAYENTAGDLRDSGGRVIDLVRSDLLFELRRGVGLGEPAHQYAFRIIA